MRPWRIGTCGSLQVRQKLAVLVTAIEAQRSRMQSLAAFGSRNQRPRLPPLGMAVSGIHGGADAQTVTVLHQHMRAMAQLRLPAEAFARQAGLGIGRALVRVVG